MLPALLLTLMAVQAPTSPTPLADNAALPYPERARGEGVEGTVTFLLGVDASGTVTSARVVEVPRGGVGIEEAFVPVLLRWKFRPALSDGMPIPSTYVGRATLERTEPFHMSRMYPQQSRVAWEAAERGRPAPTRRASGASSMESTPGLRMEERDPSASVLSNRSSRERSWSAGRWGRSRLRGSLPKTERFARTSL